MIKKLKHTAITMRRDTWSRREIYARAGRRYIIPAASPDSVGTWLLSDAPQTPILTVDRHAGRPATCMCVLSQSSRSRHTMYVHARARARKQQHWISSSVRWADPKRSGKMTSNFKDGSWSTLLISWGACISAGCCHYFLFKSASSAAVQHAW